MHDREREEFDQFLVAHFECRCEYSRQWTGYLSFVKHCHEENSYFCVDHTCCRVTTGLKHRRWKFIRINSCIQDSLLDDIYMVSPTYWWYICCPFRISRCFINYKFCTRRLKNKSVVNLYSLVKELISVFIICTRS